MIKNERQYGITRNQAEKFERALEALRKRRSDHVPTPLRNAEEAALRSQLADLRTDLEHYDRLRSRRRLVQHVNSIEELPRVLIQARIALGLSQKELADQLGLREQQIQRYEATDYASAKLARIQEVMRALGLQVRIRGVLSGQRE